MHFPEKYQIYLTSVRDSQAANVLRAKLTVSKRVHINTLIFSAMFMYCFIPQPHYVNKTCDI